MPAETRAGKSLQNRSQFHPPCRCRSVAGGKSGREFRLNGGLQLGLVVFDDQQIVALVGRLPQRRTQPPTTRRHPRNCTHAPRLRLPTPETLTLPRHYEKMIGPDQVRRPLAVLPSWYRWRNVFRTGIPRYPRINWPTGRPRENSGFLDGRTNRSGWVEIQDDHDHHTACRTASNGTLRYLPTHSIPKSPPALLRRESNSGCDRT